MRRQGDLRSLADARPQRVIRPCLRECVFHPRIRDLSLRHWLCIFSSKWMMRRRLTVAFVCTWALLVTIPLASVMAWHLVPLPVPESRDAVHFSTETGEWLAVHVFVAGCPCSSSVAEQVASRAPLPGGREMFAVLGTDDALTSTLDDSHLQPLPDSDRIALQTQLTGGPCLLVLSPDGKVVYAGGYSPRPPNRLTPIEDRQIWEEIRNGMVPAVRPMFGCAASQTLQQLQDPLGIKKLKR